MAFQNGRGNKPYGKKPYSGGSRGDKPYGNKPNSDRGDKPFEKKSYDKKPYGDKPYGDKPYGEKPYGKRPYGESDGKPFEKKSYDKKPYGDKPYGDKPYGKRSYGERDGKPFEKRPYEKKPYGDKSYGDKPYGDKPYGRKPYGERDGKPFEKKPYGDKPYGDKPYGDKPYGRKPYGERDGKPFEKKPYGDKPYGDKPYGKRPYGDRDGKPFEKKPYEKKPYGDKSYGDKSYGDKPYGKRPYGERDEKPSEKKTYEKKPYADKPYNRKPYEDDDSRPFPETPQTDDRPDAAVSETNELPYFLMGRNAVREAIKSGRSIDRILVVEEQDGSLREIIGMARDNNLVIRTVDRKRLDELCMPFGHGGKPGNHQGILAMVPDIEYATLDDILALAKERGEPPFLLLLDEINDPHNLGSMLRSAACAGVHGVVLPKRRAASVTAAVAKASAGAVEYVKVAKVVNLSVAIEQLKEAGVWIAGADMDGTPMADVDMSGPLALVIGNEAEGLSRLVRDKCDHLVSIPMRGPMDSLNASVAAAVLLFEKNRQDAAK
jgi:23S rRNA (guanosine2251-2'-O)-methyltransferase